jgi:predicted metal-dependent phosphoesterase TrpH
VTEGLKLDLHTHSNHSDGALTPQELLACAAAAGIHVLALTDHDTVAGLESAHRAAAQHGMTLVPGVEVSMTWRAQTLHVLGLWIDPGCPDLTHALAAQADLRRERMRGMCLKLNKQRLPGDALWATVQAMPGLPTRTHLAQAMTAAGLVERSDVAFRKYLAKGKPAHVSVAWPTLEQGIAWIRAAGGVAVLAHPCRYTLSSGARRRLLADFAAAGGEGLEVVSGANGRQHIEACTQMASTHGFSGSVGSDFHSPQFAWNPIGRSLKLPDCITPVWRGRLP